MVLQEIDQGLVNSPLHSIPQSKGGMLPDDQFDQEVIQYHSSFRNHKLHGLLGTIYGVRDISSGVQKSVLEACQKPLRKTGKLWNNMMKRQIYYASRTSLSTSRLDKWKLTKIQAQSLAYTFPFDHVVIPTTKSIPSPFDLGIYGYHHQIPIFANHVYTTVFFNIPNTIDAIIDKRPIKTTFYSLLTVLGASFPLFFLNTLYWEELINKPREEAMRDFLLPLMKQEFSTNPQMRRVIENTIDKRAEKSGYKTRHEYLAALNDKRKEVSSQLHMTGKQVDELTSRVENQHKKRGKRMERLNQFVSITMPQWAKDRFREWNRIHRKIEELPGGKLVKWPLHILAELNPFVATAHLGIAGIYLVTSVFPEASGAFKDAFVAGFIDTWGRNFERSVRSRPLRWINKIFKTNFSLKSKRSFEWVKDAHDRVDLEKSITKGRYLTSKLDTLNVYTDLVEHTITDRGDQLPKE